jgi:universal stress protein E
VKGFKRVLVAVRDIEGFSRATIWKVAALAGGPDSAVELFHAITEPELIETVWRDRSGRPVDAIFETITSKTRSRLERLARNAALARIKVTTSANWDYPAHEAVVRRALAIAADLVVVEAPPYGPELQPFLRHTDWQLILHCPCPVLLVRTPGRYDRAQVLVAIDPIHAVDETADLDRRLLHAGKRLAHVLNGEVHVCHVYRSIASNTAFPTSRRARSTLGIQAIPNQSVQRAFDRLASRSAVGPNHRHLAHGCVSLELARIAQKIHARILVMGALSRSSGTRDFVGTTAEQVLEHISCDVLLIKPATFKTAVRAQAALSPQPPARGLVTPLP